MRGRLAGGTMCNDRREAMEVSVSIGGAACQGLVRTSSRSIQCILPGGVGQGVDVSVMCHAWNTE